MQKLYIYMKQYYIAEPVLNNMRENLGKQMRKRKAEPCKREHNLEFLYLFLYPLYKLCSGSCVNILFWRYQQIQSLLINTFFICLATVVFMEMLYVFFHK